MSPQEEREQACRASGAVWAQQADYERYRRSWTRLERLALRLGWALTPSVSATRFVALRDRLSNVPMYWAEHRAAERCQR